MENSESTVALFAKLQALGINIQIDDFGVGYSSLSYLSNFPINALKIDQSFVQKLTLKEGHSKIIQSIVMMARGLDMDVTSEGIETVEQYNLLRQLGCEYGQGAYISMPLDPQAAYAFMLEKRVAVNLPPAELRVDLEAR
jgi:EAL domain-containing protein (putative c-di-GMP-specific phosphodiesterase class I)